MKNVKVFLPIFIVVLILPNIGFSDGKDELMKRVNSFKENFTELLYDRFSWGVQLDAGAMMHITEIIVVDHGIQEELIPFISHLAEEYSANEDVVSLLVMAAMCFHYVPKESLEMILKIIMILQAAMFEVIHANSPQKEHVFNLMSEKFRIITPDDQARLTEESQTVFNSVSQRHYSATTLFDCGEGGVLATLESSLTLPAALCQSWKISSSKSK